MEQTEHARVHNPPRQRAPLTHLLPERAFVLANVLHGQLVPLPNTRPPGFKGMARGALSWQRVRAEEPAP